MRHHVPLNLLLLALTAKGNNVFLGGSVESNEYRMQPYLVSTFFSILHTYEDFLQGFAEFEVRKKYIWICCAQKCSTSAFSESSCVQVKPIVSWKRPEGVGIPGQLKKLVLVNFMCHEHLHMSFG